MGGGGIIPLTCDGAWEGCAKAPITHLDTAGFIYCTPCGLVRRQYEPCRQMRPWEVRRLERGVPISHY